MLIIYFPIHTAYYLLALKLMDGTFYLQATFLAIHGL